MSLREKNRTKMAKWRASNPERAKASYKKIDYKRAFGLRPEEVALLLDKAKGRCEICGEAETVLSNNGNVRQLSIDHCHSTGKIRGVVCYRCNSVLGFCKDNPDLLRGLAMYVETADTGFRTKPVLEADSMLKELLG